MKRQYIFKKIILIGKLYTYAGMAEKHSDDYFTGGWNGVIARYLYATFPGEFNIESWRVEQDATETQCRQINGVRYCLFAAKKLFGKKMPDFLVLARELWRLRKQRHEIVIHFNQLHTVTLYGLLLLAAGFTFIVHQHGDINPRLNYNKHGKRRYKLYCLVERVLFRRIKKVFYLRAPERGYLTALLPQERLAFLPVGIDFKLFTPIPRQQARQALGLPASAVILLFIGVLDGRRNFSLLIEALRAATRQHTGLLLLCVGTQDKNDFTAELQGLPVKLIPWVERQCMPAYYSAADYLFVPGFAELNFMGFDLSISECLACGTPVISNQLTEFPTEVANKLGYPLFTKEEIPIVLQNALTKSRAFPDCRPTAQELLSIESFSKQLLAACKQA